MDCLILTNKTGVSFQFTELVSEGVIELMYENTGLTLKYPFSNTNFFRLSSLHFSNKGNVEIKVVIENRIVKKKKIGSYT